MKMTYDYIAELHEFLNFNNNSDLCTLNNKVIEHLKYIPNNKLYRYRQCNTRELETLESNSIWVADPQKFPDMFDTTIPMIDRRQLYFDYQLLVIYRALVNTAKSNQTLPSIEELRKAMYQTMIEFSPEELEEKCIQLFGKEAYTKIATKDSISLKLKPRIDELIEFFNALTTSPRYNLGIASFTTRYDNRNMWERYANFYTGFCVEYDFKKVTKLHNTKSAGDILHVLPIMYYKNRPLFDYDDMLERIFEADLKISKLSFKGTDFIKKYYRSILSKQYDYRAEQEWRLIMDCTTQGIYKFPYISKIYIGKDASSSDIKTLSNIGEKLDAHVFIQSQSVDRNSFEYKTL
jgi:Protein of unknown function (DUF2971).